MAEYIYQFSLTGQKYYNGKSLEVSVQHHKVMQNTLLKYLPERAVPSVLTLLEQHLVSLKIVNQRVSKHGDYRRYPNGQHQITVNASLNKYRFLITLIHEIAHLVAFETYGRAIKPHGVEWKKTFQHLMLPFINQSVFPSRCYRI